MENLFIGLERSSYAVLNGKIEQVSIWIHFCMMYLSVVGAMGPPFILSMINYFVYGLGDESFYLTYPSW